MFLSYILCSSLFIIFIVILLKYEPKEAIVPWNQHIKGLKKNKKNFRPTDPNIFRHVSGNTGNFLGLMEKLKSVFLTLTDVQTTSSNHVHVAVGLLSASKH